MTEKYLEPAKSIIAYLGGVQVVCQITGLHLSSVYRWMKSRDDKGTNGKVPYDEAEKLIEWARVNGKDLRGDDFFDPSRLQALLAEPA